MKFLMIDDSRVDRELFKAMFQDAKLQNPWLRQAEVDIVAAPPGDYKSYDAYDGVLVDMHLGGGLSGLEVIKKIHLHDWRKLVALMTGSPAAAIPADALEYANWVSLKTDGDGPACYDLLSVMRVMARTVAARGEV
jgi:CheY-like chemotaxis protein